MVEHRIGTPPRGIRPGLPAAVLGLAMASMGIPAPTVRATPPAPHPEARRGQADPRAHPRREPTQRRERRGAAVGQRGRRGTEGRRLLTDGGEDIAADGKVTVTPDETQYAFGNEGNPIQFSWELEGQGGNYRVFRHYRPRELSDEAWFEMGRRKQMEHFRDELGGQWERLVRKDDAPRFLARNLEQETGGFWETHTNGYAPTIEALFKQAEFAADKLDNDHGGFHWHVSFERDPRYAEELTALIAQAAYGDQSGACAKSSGTGPNRFPSPIGWTRPACTNTSERHRTPGEATSA